MGRVIARRGSHRLALPPAAGSEHYALSTVWGIDASHVWAASNVVSQVDDWGNPIDDSAWTPDANLINSTLLRAVWGTYTSTPTLVTYVYAVGDNGTILHYHK